MKFKVNNIHTGEDVFFNFLNGKISLFHLVVGWHPTSESLDCKQGYAGGLQSWHLGGDSVTSRSPVLPAGAQVRSQRPSGLEVSPRHLPAAGPPGSEGRGLSAQVQADS